MCGNQSFFTILLSLFLADRSLFWPFSSGHLRLTELAAILSYPVVELRRIERKNKHGLGLVNSYVGII